jgi:hypothetical protein
VVSNIPYQAPNWRNINHAKCADCARAIETHTHGNGIWYVTADAKKRPRFLHRTDTILRQCDCERGHYRKDGNCEHITRARALEGRRTVETIGPELFAEDTERGGVADCKLVQLFG